MARIIIDAGHGGSARAGNSSAYGSRGPSGLLEKDVTLDIARQVVARLGGDAAMTRVGDSNLPLGARAAHASRDGADVFVSIHANSGPPEMAGPETWVHPDAGADSHALAGGIQRALERLAGRYGGSTESRRGPMAVLSPGVLGRRTAACLVEVDYLSNPRGERRLGDAGERAAIGAAIAGAIREHVGSGYGQQANRNFVLRGNEPVRIGVNARVGTRTARLRGTATLTQAAHTPRLRARLFDQAAPDQPQGHAQYIDLSHGTSVSFDFTFRLGLTPGVFWIELAVEGSDATARVQIVIADVLIALNEGETGEAVDYTYGSAYGQGHTRTRSDPWIEPPINYNVTSLDQANQIWSQFLREYGEWRTGVPATGYAHFPHSAICQLKLYAANSTNPGYGTGFYIGREKILTCGHNFKLGSHTTARVVVQPGHSGNASLFPEREYTVNAQSVVHPQWWSTEAAEWDLAVLHVPGLPAPNGSFSLPNQSPGGSTSLVMCGYGKFPGSDWATQGQTMHGVTADRTRVAPDNQGWFMPIHGIPGHSGSPVFAGSMVVGVFTRMTGPTGDFDPNYNYVVRLDPDRLGWINGM